MKMLSKEGLHPLSDLHADGPHLLTKKGCSARYMFTDLLYPPSHTSQLTCKDDTRSGGLRGRHSLAIRLPWVSLLCLGSQRVRKHAVLTWPSAGHTQFCGPWPRILLQIPHHNWRGSWLLLSLLSGQPLWILSLAREASFFKFWQQCGVYHMPPLILVSWFKHKPRNFHVVTALVSFSPRIWFIRVSLPEGCEGPMVPRGSSLIHSP